MSAKATLCAVSSKLPLSQFMLSQEQLDQIPSEADKIKRLRSKITSLDLQRMNSGGACGSTIEPLARQCPNQLPASPELHVDAGGSAGSAETSGACPARPAGKQRRRARPGMWGSPLTDQDQRFTPPATDVRQKRMTLQAGAEQPEPEYYFSWTVHYLRKNYPPGCGKSYSVAEVGDAYMTAHPHHVGCTRWLQDGRHMRITDVESAAYCGMPAKLGRNLQCKRSPPDAERDPMPLDQPCT